MDGSDKPADLGGHRAKHKALFEYGIRGGNLKKLAAEPSITLPMILAEWERIKQDGAVRNRPAVLAAALAAHANIQLGSGRISKADLDPAALMDREEAEVLATKVEALRRKNQMAASGAG